MPKFLVIRFSSIGDIVLTTPVVRHLRQIPHAEIHYCTRKDYQAIVANNPHIDKVFVLKNSLLDLATALKVEKYDYIIDLHHNLRTLKLKTLLGVYSFWGHKPQCASFNKLNYEKFIYVNFKRNIMPTVHIVDRYLDTLTALNLPIQFDNKGLDYFIPLQDNLDLTAILPTSHQQGYVAYAMGAQHNTKKLPLQKMIDLCLKIQAPLVLLGDKKDAVIAQEIEKYITQTNLINTNSTANTQNNHLSNNKARKTVIYNACGKFNLNQSAYLLQQAKVVFAHDTGLMHIAAALNKKVYSIWGNTTPSLGMYPYKTDFVVLENNIACRPCSKIGFDQCPKKHFDCMNSIDFSEVENTVFV
jgi:ADP-heptose:LPS heptosyltransferase